MPLLDDLERLLAAAESGEPAEPEERDPVALVTAAIRDMQIVIENSSEKDYAPALASLGDILKRHGDALVKAMGSIAINVEAPTVNVEPTPITISPSLKMPARKPPNLKVRVTERDGNGDMSEIVIEPFTGKLPAPKSAQHSYD